MLIVPIMGKPGPIWRTLHRSGAVLFALLLATAAAQAAGPIGPVGPVGPTGAIGPVGPAEGAAADTPRHSRPNVQPPRAVPAQPPASAAGAGNRIEVSGNTASGTGCAADGGASVNSVDISGARLEGRTVIVQGRNANDVRTRDCSPDGPPGHGAAGQTNSVRIR